MSKFMKWWTFLWFWYCLAVAVLDAIMGHPWMSISLLVLSLFLMAADPLLTADRILYRDLSAYPSLCPQGTVSSGYGPRWHRIHEGIDYACPVGTPVRAMGAGTVVFAGHSNEYEGYGNLVITVAGSLELRYAHLSVIAVEVGDEVGRGHILGYSGDSGRSTGPHLHAEIRINGVPVNPGRYLVR